MGVPPPDDALVVGTGMVVGTSVTDPFRSIRVANLTLTAGIEHQVQMLERAKEELKALVELAARPGLPVVYDTNMLNHWQQPGGVMWRQVFKDQGEDVPLTRLVVPLAVVDELDRQKYGRADSDLAKRATTAIRYLERTMAASRAGEPVPLREDVTLEVWVETDERGGDADLAILRCAGDLDTLHPGAGTRVLTDDLGMRLRAQQMGLKAMRLGSEYRKPGTAVADAVAAHAD